MATVDLTNPIFTDLDAARKHFEDIRWPDGAYCPYCGQWETVKPLGGRSMGPGGYHCKDCRCKFSEKRSSFVTGDDLLASRDDFFRERL